MVRYDGQESISESGSSLNSISPTLLVHGLGSGSLQENLQDPIAVCSRIFSSKLLEKSTRKIAVLIKSEEYYWCSDPV